MTIKLKVGSSWQDVPAFKLKVGSAWKNLAKGYIKTGSIWKIFFGKAGPQPDFPLEISSNSTSYPATLTGTNYHWDSGDTFTSKFQKGSTAAGPWSDVTSFEFIANPAVGSFNTKTLILLETHFILNQSSTFFRFVVKGVNSISNETTTETSDPIEISVPDAVMSHSGGAIVSTSTSISIPFTYNSFLKYYIVEAYGPSGLVSSTRVNTPSSPVLVQNLSPNTTYDIVIFPYNFVDIVGTALLGIGITTLAGVPGPVTNLTRSTGNGGSKTFSWSAPTTGGAVASYEYQLNSFGFISNGSSTSISLTGLSGTNTFQVRAVNAGGSGTSTSTGSFIVPTINSGPTAGSITSSGATVSWSSSNQSSYSLSVPGAGGTPFTGTTATSRSITLSSSTSYTPTLTITSSTGDTATTTGASFTTLAPPPSPPTITSSSSTTTSITLNFNLGANSTSTRAYLNGNFDGGTSSTSYTFFGLAPGTSYTLALFGYNGTQQSSTSSGGTYSTQTGPALTPTFGSNISTTGGFFGSVTNYDANYTWGISASVGSVSWSLPSGSTRSFTVSGLAAGQSSTVTVTTSRAGYNNGSAQTTGSASVPVQYTVTWNANGGSVSPSSNTVNAGSSVTAPTPTRSGYTFNYWRNPISGGDPTIIYAGGSYTPTGNITFYAIWTLNVSIPSGGSVSLTGGNTAGSTITASTSGWSGSPTSYDVYITTALSPNIPTSSSSRVASSGGGSSTTYTITSFDTVSPVNIFRAFATASNSAGTSGIVQSSNTITAQSSSPATAPGTPGTPTNGWTGGTTYPFSWTAPGPGTVAGGGAATITNYSIIIYEANNAAGTGAVAKTPFNTGSGSSSYTYTSPNAALYYAASVAAINSAGLQGPYSGISQYK